MFLRGVMSMASISVVLLSVTGVAIFLLRSGEQICFFFLSVDLPSVFIFLIVHVLMCLTSITWVRMWFVIYM